MKWRQVCVLQTSVYHQLWKKARSLTNGFALCTLFGSPVGILSLWLPSQEKKEEGNKICRFLFIHRFYWKRVCAGQEVRRCVINAIITTDMSHHFPLVAKAALLFVFFLFWSHVYMHGTSESHLLGLVTYSVVKHQVDCDPTSNFCLSAENYMQNVVKFPDIFRILIVSFIWKPVITKILSPGTGGGVLRAARSGHRGRKARHRQRPKSKP